MRNSILRRLSAVALFAAVVASPARADEFTTANVQVLQAFNMKDGAPTDGDQTTATLNLYSTHRFGDVNFFLDLSRARGSFGDGNDASVYGEIAPRLLLGRMFGVKVPGFKDFGAAFELNQGSNFYAYLAGVGGDFALPLPGVVGANVFYRYDKFLGDTAQFTGYWNVPFAISNVGLAFAGFVDVTQATEFATGDKGIDVMTQPQLLLDVGRFFAAPNRFWFGGEYWLHKNPNQDSQALQAMFQYTIR